MKHRAVVHQVDPTVKLSLWVVHLPRPSTEQNGAPSCVLHNVDPQLWGWACKLYQVKCCTELTPTLNTAERCTMLSQQLSPAPLYRLDVTHQKAVKPGVVVHIANHWVVGPHTKYAWKYFFNHTHKTVVNTLLRSSPFVSFYKLIAPLFLIAKWFAHYSTYYPILWIII